MSVNITTVSPQGQISLPLDVCEKMKLSAGSQSAFMGEDDPVVMNPTIRAMEKLQKEMECEWEKAGIHSEEDVIALCREIRREVATERRLKGHG